MSRVLVCGGRDYANWETLRATLLQHTAEGDVIIHGGASGADVMAGEFALMFGRSVKVFPADWEQYGRAAGPVRNQHMLVIGRPDMVIAFPGGRGTADMVRRARRAGVPVVEAAE